MSRRPTARELERREARRGPAAGSEGSAAGEPARMLRRRGLSPRPTPLDLPFPDDLPEAEAARLAGRLSHYAFRLFLRGAILRPHGFAPRQATRYLGLAQATRMAEDLVKLGLAERLCGGRFRLLRRARSFGGTLEWYLGRELSRRLGLEVALGLRSGAAGVGGDLDVVAAAEGKLLYLEVKSSPPKHIERAEVAAFLRRVRALRPDVALFVVDTALRLSDKVLPMFAAELGPGERPRRVVRETWALTPHLYAVNARQDLIENLCRAIAEGLKALSPSPPGAGAEAASGTGRGVGTRRHRSGARRRAEARPRVRLRGPRPAGSKLSVRR
ncbi:MAG TPA: hypothetical protein VFR85_02660 [Anaeromyxobacteraceae bacterium]|nr:hypothetical protein [Anaeromyxobacteraceae bacterium]